MKIINCSQRSPEWYAARLGKWTASFFDKALSPKTLNPLKGAHEVNLRLAAEIITGEPEHDFFKSDAMERGAKLEEEAFKALEFTHGYEFEQCGFIDSELGYGASVDGINYKRRMTLELKCLRNFEHIKTLAEGVLPVKYLMQVQGHLLVTGYEKAVFFAYSPTMPSFVIEVVRDESVIGTLRRELVKNVSEVNRFVERVRGLAA